MTYQEDLESAKYLQGLESAKYLPQSEEETPPVPPAPPAEQAKPPTNSLAGLTKGVSVIVAVTLLAVAGAWVWVNRASLREAATSEISLGYLVTGKTWEEYKKEGKFGSFDTAFWPEAEDDPDRKAYWEDYYRTMLPDQDFNFDSDS